MTGHHPYLCMLLSGACFAVMGTAAHALRDRCDWQVIAAARCLLALVLVGAAAARSGVRVPVLRPAALWVRGVFGSLSLVGMFYAMTRLPVSCTFTLFHLYPVWMALLSWPLLGRRPGPAVWGAAVCGAAGVWLIRRPELVPDPVPLLVAVGCSLAAAAAMIGIHFLRHIDPRAVVVHFSGVSVVFCVGAFALLPRDGGAAVRFDAFTAAGLAVVGASAAAAQVLMTRAFMWGDPAKVSLVGLSEVVFVLAADVVVWGYAFDGWTAAGVALVLVPTARVVWGGSGRSGAGRCE